jgi:MYXO-CTERM domain-containing protein
MDCKRWIGPALAGVALLYTAQAYAHFKQLSPTSWLNEDALGGPQKGSPCGPGNARPFIGDDVQPIPASNAVTTFHAGETITVRWQETVYHPGYFRIALAPVHAADATSSDFPDPALSDPSGCHYDPAAVQTVPHDNVLADGLYMVDDQNGTNRSLMQEVKLPNEPCDHCTLQLVQVMEGHPAASCFYFHCAEITILPADSAHGAAGTGSSTPAGSHKNSGCSVASAGTGSSTVAAWCLLAVVATFARRRPATPPGPRRRLSAPN